MSPAKRSGSSRHGYGSGADSCGGRHRGEAGREGLAIGETAGAHRPVFGASNSANGRANVAVGCCTRECYVNGNRCLEPRKYLETKFLNWSRTSIVTGRCCLSPAHPSTPFSSPWSVGAFSIRFRPAPCAKALEPNHRDVGRVHEVRTWRRRCEWCADLSIGCTQPSWGSRVGRRFIAGPGIRFPAKCHARGQDSYMDHSIRRAFG